MSRDLSHLAINPIELWRRKTHTSLIIPLSSLRLRKPGIRIWDINHLHIQAPSESHFRYPGNLSSKLNYGTLFDIRSAVGDYLQKTCVRRTHDKMRHGNISKGWDLAIESFAFTRSPIDYVLLYNCRDDIKYCDFNALLSSETSPLLAAMYNRVYTSMSVGNANSSLRIKS